ncbi:MULTISPECIES: Na+/H+ antiporter NhaC family protein [unclassified Lentimicrobium]|uniref:Na+/H+ antiporter NhaC family protein n=1 Tax=unclassified Lentimicrobium TaxID=2677434 RepID=UPI0015541A59|nr:MULTISPECIES: Na+/H+ antiporter NhaC family protein [unclassified Lentimicrobium]NPD44476.1 Na+/H+ antiporter NhaC family protein [Lentimicrobium sp. S6]NPD84224.1 Na+/H+ antiporter NhaC family protein [Lentimicrobium sp. L6]
MNPIKYSSLVFLFALFFLLVGKVESVSSQETTAWSVEKPLIIMQGIELDFPIKVNASDSFLDVYVNGKAETLEIIDGYAYLPIKIDVESIIKLESTHGVIEVKVNPIPLWFSIIPPLVAIFVALVFKEVFTALFMGIFIGTTTIQFFYGESFFAAIYKGFFSIITDYIIGALNDPGHLSIIVFSMLIGGMVHIITKNGGMAGVVAFLSKYAKTRKSGQFITWLLGISIFFDDYANTLVVGNTMRPVTDRLKVSREKLAYLVDSTAAPIASIALITTWVGAELSYIQDGIKQLNIHETPYVVFLNSLQYSFYPIFTLGFVLMVIFTGRDFGPMRKAEIKIKHIVLKEIEKETPLDDSYQPKKGVKPHAFNALIPVLVVVFGTIAGLVITGLESSTWSSELSFYRNLSGVIGNADSYVALLWSSLAGVFIAVILSVSQRLLNLKESMDSMVDGFRIMLTAILILTLAWALAALTENIHTAEFISGSLIDLQISPYLIPALAFVLAALVAFSTGSSWGTMAILYPLMLPAIWLLATEAGLSYDESIVLFHNVVSVILAGSVMGDHCSPISDTTIMSSLASQCNHIEHVRTQLPYALSVGGVSLLLGTLPVAFGFPIILSYILGFGLLFMVIRYFGKTT